jgi:2-amino-4-hydroxy-6-hydroxymethyldihydropteridine diphosphokinase
MYRYIISIGSNFHAEASVEGIRRQLRMLFGEVAFSPFEWTPPIGKHYTLPFYNGAAAFDSDLPPEKLMAMLKSVETDAGRRPEMKQAGIVPADLDIIVVDNKIVHNDYHRFFFVKEAVDRLLHANGH